METEKLIKKWEKVFFHSTNGGNGRIFNDLSEYVWNLAVSKMACEIIDNTIAAAQCIINDKKMI